MRKTDKLELLCKRLVYAEPDWGKIIARFKSHPNFNPAKELFDRQYAQYFSEIHMDISLEQIAGTYPDLNMTFRPFLKGKTRARDFLFYYDLAGRVYAQGIREPAKFEYDQVILIDGMPVVFEIKIKKWNSSVNEPGKLRNALLPEVYNKRLHPVRQFFDNDVGYVFIIPKDVYDGSIKFEGDSLINNFIKNGGVLVPFYTDRHTFRRHVAQNVELNGLRSKPEVPASDKMYANAG